MIEAVVRCFTFGRKILSHEEIERTAELVGGLFQNVSIVRVARVETRPGGQRAVLVAQQAHTFGRPLDAGVISVSEPSNYGEYRVSRWDRQ